MDTQSRISRFAEEAFPGSTVLYDEATGGRFRFRIEDSNGRILSRSYPLFSPEEIDSKPDDELRALICQLCGR